MSVSDRVWFIQNRMSPSFLLFSSTYFNEELWIINFPLILHMADTKMCFCMLNLSGGHKMIIIVVNVSKPQLHETPQASSYFPVQCIIPCIPLWMLISLALDEIWMKNFHCVCVCIHMCVFVFKHHGTNCSPHKFFLDHLEVVHIGY